MVKNFACPKCKQSLYNHGVALNCNTCRLVFKKEGGIWHFNYLSDQRIKKAQAGYELTHQEISGGPKDGSYQILAAFAKGNKTLDIACGEGLIEQLAPETVGLDFSLNALKKAKRNGAKYLIWGNAQSLPFLDNSFDVAISAGSLEHFPNPQKAIYEMARVSKIQILTVHKSLPFPFADFIHNSITKILNITHQPIEQPIHQRSLEKMLQKTGLYVVFKGVWTLPLNYGHIIKFLPEFKNIPSCSFVISIKP